MCEYVDLFEDQGTLEIYRRPESEEEKQMRMIQQSMKKNGTIPQGLALAGIGKGLGGFVPSAFPMFGRPGGARWF